MQPAWNSVTPVHSLVLRLPDHHCNLEVPYCCWKFYQKGPNCSQHPSSGNRTLTVDSISTNNRGNCGFRNLKLGHKQNWGCVILVISKVCWYHRNHWLNMLRYPRKTYVCVLHLCKSQSENTSWFALKSFLHWDKSSFIVKNGEVGEWGRCNLLRSKTLIKSNIVDMNEVECEELKPFP